MSFRVLGVDPGSRLMGVAVIQYDHRHPNALSWATLNIGKEKSFPARLSKARFEILELINQYKPDVIAIERAFVAMNVQSALKLGYARGVALCLAGEFDIPVVEINPTEVKKQITGMGRADKEQVRDAIAQIFGITDVKSIGYDASDALGIALVGGQNYSFERRIESN